MKTYDNEIIENVFNLIMNICKMNREKARFQLEIEGMNLFSSYSLFATL